MLRADRVAFVHGAPGRQAREGGGRGPAPLPGVQDISVRVSPGDVLGLLGPNGSGKTTLLRLLGGLLAPASGRVTLDGRDLSNLPRRALARRLAIVPQETHLAFDYTVTEVALMGRYPHLGPFELEGPHDLAVASASLEATGTAHLAHRSFATLSGGEKQRVIIASALAQEADILLLDEPTASLDLGHQLDVIALLRRLNRDRQIAIVVATHDLNFAASLCRTLLLVRQGRELAQGPVQEVLTRAHIAALYDVDAEVQFHDAAGHLAVMPLGRHGPAAGGRA